MKTQLSIEKKGKERTYDSYISKLANWYGFGGAAILTLFFLIMKTFNLHEVLGLRYLNFFFILSVLLLAFIKFKRKIKDTGIDYFTGIKIGLWISFLAVVPFALFMACYLTIDNSFMELVRNSTDWGVTISPVLAAGGIMVEGLSSGAIITFMAMQYFKKEKEKES